MKIKVITLRIEAQSAHKDSLPGMLLKVANQLQDEIEEEVMRYEDGDQIKWSHDESPVRDLK